MSDEQDNERPERTRSGLTIRRYYDSYLLATVCVQMLVAELPTLTEAPVVVITPTGLDLDGEWFTTLADPDTPRRQRLVREFRAGRRSCWHGYTVEGIEYADVEPATIHRGGALNRPGCWWSGSRNMAASYLRPPRADWKKLPGDQLGLLRLHFTPLTAEAAQLRMIFRGTATGGEDEYYMTRPAAIWPERADTTT